MQYKPSYYNQTVKLDSGENLLYNFLTGGLVEVEDGDVENIKYVLEHCNEELEGHLGELKTQLIDTFYLIPEDTNELNILRTRNLTRRFDDANKYLVVMPTMDCNFTCKYCYESRVKGFISEHVIQGVKNWADQMVKNGKYLGIGWFGGEPLLGFPIIEEINTYVKKICAENNVVFYSNITTNGYLLNDYMMSRFKDLEIQTLQITIDGTPEYHNKYRALRNGDGTFDVVFANTLKLLDQTDANVTLRVNVDLDNYDSVPAFMDMIPEKYRTDKLRIYFRSIFPGPNENLGVNDQINEKRINTYDVIKHLYFYAMDHGFTLNFPVLNTKEHYCESCLKNHFVIHPSGDIFKCTVEFEMGNRIGVITEDSQVDLDFSTYSKWLEHVPGDDPQCAMCKFLPVCNGGCRYQRLIGHRGCPYESSDIKGFLEMLHLSTVLNRPLE